MKVIKNANILKDRCFEIYEDTDINYKNDVIFSLDNISFLTADDSKISSYEEDYNHYIKYKFIRDYIQGYIQ